MKVTKSQLRRIIQEEVGKDLKKRKVLLREFGSMDMETGSYLIEFARAYAGLGGAIQQQVDALANAYILQGAHDPDWTEAVYEQNPNAIEEANRRMAQVLKRLASEGVEEAEYLMDMLKEALEIYKKGDEEVEADARAAGDR